MNINWCNLGFHKWKYTIEGSGRWCVRCPEKQEQVWGLGVDGEWVHIRPTKMHLAWHKGVKNELRKSYRP